MQAAKVSLRVLALAALGATLAGCSSGASDMAANLLAFNTPTAPAAPAGGVNPNAPRIVSCPSIETLDGEGSYRVGGPASASVRHQYSMAEAVRECTLNGGQIGLRVGVEGLVLLGPAGSPGSFSVPIRVSVRNERDQKIVASKTYRTSASVPSGDSQGSFRIVSDTLTVPFVSEDAGDDYTIIVSFDRGAGQHTAAKSKKRR